MPKNITIKEYMGKKININHLVNQLLEQVEMLFDEYVFLVSHWFAYTILTETKHILTHNFDTPSDSSGTIVNTNLPLKIKDYQLLKNFWNEWNGNSYPIYENSRKFKHDTYLDELQDYTFTWVFEQLTKVTAEMIPLHSNEFIEELTMEILNDDNHLDHTYYAIVESLIEAIGEMQSKILFMIGKETALEDIEEENLQKKESSLDSEKTIAANLWKKVKAMYAIRYSEILPDRIESHIYTEKVRPLLMELVKGEVPIEHIRLLGFWGNCSSIVSQDLKNFSI
jgi:hypothetical protein